MISRHILVEYDIGEEIYLKTDEQQLIRIVYAYMVFQNSILYRCCCGKDSSDHYDFEMSKEKVLYK